MCCNVLMLMSLILLMCSCMMLLVCSVFSNWLVVCCVSDSIDVSVFCDSWMCVCLVLMLL